MDRLSRRTQTLLSFLPLAISFIFLWQLNKYSFCWSDESFYLSTPYRLLQGDKLFVDEWSPTQLYTPLLLPLMRLFRLLKIEAVMLASRKVALCIHFITTAGLFCFISRKNPLAGFLASLPFLWYVRANILGLSYYMLSLDWYVTGILLIAYSKLFRHKRLLLFFAGIFEALSVLCNPYIAIIWFVYALFFTGSTLFHKKTLDGWYWIVVGCACTALVYLAWLFSHISLTDFFHHIPYLLIDPEYENGARRGLLHYLKVLFKPYIRILPLIFLAGLLLVVAVWQRKRNRVLFHVALYLDLALAFVMLFWFQACPGSGFIATTLLAASLYVALSFPTFFREEDCQYFFLPGIWLSMAYYLASNTGISAMTIGFALSSASLPCILSKANKAHISSRWYLLALYAFEALLCLQLMYQRFTFVYRDAHLKELDTTIDRGPAKLLRTSQIRYTQYCDVYSYIQELQTAFPSKTILFSPMLPWGYLVAGGPYPAPSTWRVPIDDIRLELYGKDNHALPDIVVVIGDQYPISNKKNTNSDSQNTLLSQGYKPSPAFTHEGWNVYVNERIK